ncbi:unnamed protein product [Candidula unifasciata]|uniref:Uncharacterized protein n=1 Tax=Candidula unifasciata TaxID=100452 RepID=A0A8S3ZS43_9EUPU|nr:unnamed protein product [Candidula unifasciata]
MEEKVSETEKDANVSEIENANTKKKAKLRPTEEKIGEAEVSKKKAKVSFKLGLGDDDDIWSSCSDISFEVSTDNISTPNTSAKSNSHSSSQAAATKQVKKKRKRQSKGGIRHRTASKQQRDSVQSQDFSKKAWLAHEKAVHLQEKDKAAAATRYSEEQHLVIFPTAPFNSTQYLIEEHNKNSPPGNIDWFDSSVSNSPNDQTPLPLSPSETNLEAVQFPKRDQEFTDSLVKVQAESLQNLPKEELVKSCMHLEQHVAALYKQVGEAENELKQEQEDEEDVFLTGEEHIDRRFMFESVYNSEANSLSSNNEDFVDLSGVNQQPVCVKESNVFTCENPVTPSTNCNSSESSS